MAALLAVVLAVLPVSATRAAAGFVPVGNDSFYHSRRILDTAAEPGSFYQFDARVDPPRGELITWPWAYDYAMARITRAALASGLAASADAALAYIAPLASAIAVLLAAWIAAQLGLGAAGIVAAAALTALYPRNVLAYAVGMTDHHFAEHLMVLATLAIGLAWLRAPARRDLAVALGVVLGLAVGVHSALSILQLPLLGALGLVWLRGTETPRTVRWTAAALLATTLAIALPSLPLREGRFDLAYLSWFQPWLALGSSALLWSWSSGPATARRIGIAAAIAVVIAAPTVAQLLLAREFLSGAMASIGTISETQSWITLLDRGGWSSLINQYSVLVLLYPFVALGALLGLWRDTQPALRYFWAFALFGAVLLPLQLRLHYFGSVLLYLVPLLLLARAAHSRSLAPTWPLAGFGAVAVALMIMPAVAIATTRKPLGMDPYYQATQPVFPTLAAACRARPGLVLSLANDGHYVRYHTECSVIANNFLLTPAQQSRAREGDRLMSLSVDEVLRERTDLRYVYVRTESLFYISPTGYVTVPQGMEQDPDRPLVKALLADDAPARYPQLTLLSELRLDYRNLPYARVFEVNATGAARTQ